MLHLIMQGMWDPLSVDPGYSCDEPLGMFRYGESSISSGSEDPTLQSASVHT